MKKFNSWVSQKTYVKNTVAIQGLGLFAKEPIKKGEKVVEMGGVEVDRNLAYHYDDVVGDYSVQIDENLFLVPTAKNKLQKDDRINHSCNPNLGFKGKRGLIAMRDIKENEELTFDYAMSISDPYYLVCKCKSSNCRKAVTGDDWRREDLHKKYKRYLSPYLAKKISKLSGI
ncbi:hypothetical protein A2870_04520 [Candidatus Curtissbacteria bacterium RIFCSPHIGHO2_01_FULL_41_11]|uniref:SET domain-containing protein n=1 Tax=Candidatus Curtissbacteria bacterium RIFCSPHIGHO2_01_FULL_41_11 TaxID=1797711 RepID=A0A1F5G878_9BACT|nr:MAG: hypothetical protein A2870_04520 [Candidatus Curtissbacteria bacterium RIFCSPHIGHO2_01_FULL_41_11]